MILLTTTRLLAILAVVWTLGAMVPRSAAAVPLFEATAGTQSQSGSTPAGAADGATLTDGALTRSYAAVARADRGSLGALADADASILGDQSCSGCDIGSRAFARATFDDLIFSGPAGADEVMTAIRLHIAGSLITGGSLGSLPEAFQSIASANFNATVAEPSGFGPRVLGGSASGLDARHVASNDPPSSFMQTRRFGDLGSATSDSDSIGVSELVTGGQFLVPLDEELILILDMQVTASALVDARLAGSHSVTSSANGDFLSTLSFPTSGPVFDLPTGYTVNSLSGLIADNRWVGAPANDVPEPGSLALLGLGIAGLAGAGWRRGKRNG
jgi:hypothetical protein